MFNESEIRTLIKQGALLLAAEELSKRLLLAPEDISALKLRAEVEFKRGNREVAFDDAMRAVRLCPADASYGLDCAYNLLRVGRRDDALTIADLVAGAEPEGADHRDALGTIYTHCERPDAALRHFEYACQQSPDCARLWHNLASVQRMLGDAGCAESSLNVAISLDGTDGSSFLSRSQLRRQSPEHNHVEELKAALQRTVGVKDRVLLGYALAKELEDLSQFEESFRFLSAATKAHRARLNYDSGKELATLRGLRDLQYPPQPSTPISSVGAAPIFVLGLPRSGTTLVERIIASTKQVRSAGEPNTLTAELWRIAGRGGRPAHGPETMIQTIKENGEDIGRAYMKLLEARFCGARFVDKTPSNYLYAGLIRAHIPGARIICLRRNPMDVCFAMYKTLFFGVYDFTYDINELAEYFIEWDRLIAQWETTLGDCWLTVDYEALVYDPEKTMRRIIHHCELDWSDACLQFYKLTTPVTSASAGQVSSPINDRSIGLWHHYGHELSGLADRLRIGGIDVRG